MFLYCQNIDRVRSIFHQLKFSVISTCPVEYPYANSGGCCSNDHKENKTEVNPLCNGEEWDGIDEPGECCETTKRVRVVECEQKNEQCVDGVKTGICQIL